MGRLPCILCKKINLSAVTLNICQYVYLLKVVHIKLKWPPVCSSEFPSLLIVSCLHLPSFWLFWPCSVCVSLCQRPSGLWSRRQNLVCQCSVCVRRAMLTSWPRLERFSRGRKTWRKVSAEDDVYKMIKTSVWEYNFIQYLNEIWLPDMQGKNADVLHSWQVSSDTHQVQLKYELLKINCFKVNLHRT